MKLFGPYQRKKKTKKQERKANRIITLDGELKIARRSNDNVTLVSETSHKQNHCGNPKTALNEKPTDSPQ